MDSVIRNSDLFDSLMGLSHKQQDITVHEIYKWMWYVFTNFKYKQKLEKYKIILKNKNSDTTFKKFYEQGKPVYGVSWKNKQWRPAKQ